MIAAQILIIKKLIAALSALIVLMSGGVLGNAVVSAVPIATTTPIIAVVKLCTVIGQQGTNYFKDLTTGKISTTTSTEAEYDALGTKNPINPTKTNTKWLYSTKSRICQ